MFRKTALLICDLQTKVMSHIKGPQVIDNVLTLIEANKEYRNIHASESAPIIIAELLPNKLGLTVPEVRREVDKIGYHNHNHIITKDTYSIYSRQLADLLREQEVRKILLTGVQTEWCISMTAQDFQNNGFEVIIPHDAVGSTDEKEHVSALKRFTRNGVDVTSTHSFIVGKLFHVEHPLSKWYVNRLRNKTHPNPE